VVREWISRHAIGATLPNLNTSILSALPFVVPPRAEQEAIVAVLGALDDKIGLNRQMNETLEAMARAIFKSWFVDFDPVQAKAEGRQPRGMDATTAALFPDSFQASPFGRFPKGWSPTTWGRLVSLEYGKALSSYAHETGPYPVYGTNGRIGTCVEPLCRHPSIVVGRKGAYRGVHFCPIPFYVIDTAFYVVPKVTLNIRWAWYEMLRLDINSMDSGSAIPSTSREDFYSLPVVCPPLEIQQQFASTLSACWDCQAQNEGQDRTLVAIRDALLPKLTSGEIRVKDAERIMGKVM
jgi:type I restriction enzyme S subunit